MPVEPVNVTHNHFCLSRKLVMAFSCTCINLHSRIGRIESRSLCYVIIEPPRNTKRRTHAITHHGFVLAAYAQITSYVPESL